MASYAERWRLAVALKQGYPRPDTGAEDSTTTTTAAPPTFEVAPPTFTVEGAWSLNQKVGFLALAFIAGAGIAAFATADIAKGAHRYG